MTFRLLACGCNLYPGAPAGSDLRGCLNDVADVADILGALGYQVEKLENAQANRADIINRLNQLIINSRPGDHVAFFYSGHGTRIPDSSGEEADGWDEAIACYDFPSGVIRDDEFRTLFSKLPAGVTANAIFDTCYSGTITRDIAPPGRIKSIPYPMDASPPPKPKGVVPGIKERVWSACKADQYSYEVTVGGVYRGAFTYFLCLMLRSFTDATDEQLLNGVTTLLHYNSIPQDPQLEQPPGLTWVHPSPFF